MTQRGRVLVIGYGNPGRRDDGLGPALVAALEPLDLPGVDLEADYQLTVEDAAAAAEHEVVIFADADVAGAEPFAFRAARAGGHLGFSTHGCRPGEVLALARDLFAAAPRGYILGIRGYEFDQFGEGLSDRAKANLAAATQFLAEVLRKGSFDDAAGPEPGEDPPAARTQEETPCKTAST